MGFGPVDCCHNAVGDDRRGRPSWGGRNLAPLPKFVIGFLIASLVTTIVSHGYSFAEFKKDVDPLLVGPVKNLRTWAFIFCFFSIGLTTRVSELAKASAKPFYAFTAGVVVNVILGYILSTQVFVSFWTNLGQ